MAKVKVYNTKTGMILNIDESAVKQMSSQWLDTKGVILPEKFKTTAKDVFNTFTRTHGRKPSTKEDWTNIAYLMTKPPTEVERRLQETSPIKKKVDKNKRTKKQLELDSAYERITKGKDSLKDRANVNYATERKGYKPPKVNTSTTKTNDTTKTGDTTKTNNTTNKSTEETKDIYANSDKIIYKDPNSPNELYYKMGDKFYKIEDPKKLQELVGAGFKDSRIDAPQGFNSGLMETDADYQTRLNEALGEIDKYVADGTLPKDLGELYKAVVKGYPRGVEFEADQVLNEFEKIKSETIDPYFKELADIAKKDFSETYSRLEQSRDRETEQEKAMYDKDVAGGRSELERSGLTFSGQGIDKLGAKSAYARDEETVIPRQEAFGGEYAEGSIPKANRLIASSTRQRYEEAKQNLGRQAENYLGTASAQQIGIPFQSAGVNRTGKLTEARQSTYGSRLQDIINNYRTKQAGQENINFNFK